MEAHWSYIHSQSQLQPGNTELRQTLRRIEDVGEIANRIMDTILVSYDEGTDIEAKICQNVQALIIVLASFTSLGGDPEQVLSTLNYLAPQFRSMSRETPDVL